MSDDFKSIVAASPVLLERWTTLSESMIEEAAEAGIPITKSDLATLSGVKIAVISGDLDYAKDWQAQARLSIPAFEKAAELEALKSAIQDEKHSEHSKAVAELEGMSLEARMRHARSIGTSTKIEVPKPLSASEKARHIQICEGLRGGQRMAYARKFGL